MALKKDVLTFDGWPKGVNLTAHPSLLDPQELAQASNVILGPKGELEQRPGVTQFSIYNDAETYTQIMGIPTEDLFWISYPPPEVYVSSSAFLAKKESAGKVYIVVEHNNARSEVEVEDGVGIVATSIIPTFFMNNLIYVGHFEVDMSATPVNPVARGAWPASSDTTTEVLVSVVRPLVAYERVFGVHGTRRYRLYFSEPLLPRTWKTTNFIDINPDDEQTIQGLFRFADQMVIFKENSIWGISGTDFSSLSGLELYQIDGAIGTKAPRTIVDIGSLLAFMDPTKGIFLFDGSVFHNIGEPIFQYLRENWNADEIEKAHAWYHEGRYHLSIPMGVETEPSRTFVFDALRKAWTVWERAFTDVTVTRTTPGGDFSNTLSVVGVTAAAQPQTFDGFWEVRKDTLADDDGNIDVNVQTGWLAPSGGFARHRIHQTVLDMAKTQAETTIAVDTEYDTTTPEASVTIVPAGEEEGGQWRTHAFNGFRWRAFKITLDSVVTSSVTDPFQLNSIRLLVSTLDQGRGENVTVV